jgi:hypothetical protein
VIPPPLIAHEEVHGQRQCVPNGAITRTINIERWWSAYLTDPEFRYREELAAHAAEYNMQAHHTRDRNDRAKLLMATARRLAAPLYAYGSSQPTLQQAMKHLATSTH